MKDFKAYFREWTTLVSAGEPLRGNNVEDLYQAFTARRESEAKEKLTTVFEAVGCRCPAPDAIRDGGTCKWFDNDESCTHPSNKPSEPECEHGKKTAMYHHKQFTGYIERSYKDSGDTHCRDCGDKL